MKFCNAYLISLLLLFATGKAGAQLIVTNPGFPADNDYVEVTFDATLGSGGLAGYTGDVYAHTGVITNLSTGPSDWKYVKTNWGQNTADTKLERIGTDLYKLVISPDIRQYYGVPASEVIEKLAFVFRSAAQVGGSYLEGKTETGGDIFADVYPEGLFTRFDLPADKGLLVNPGEQISIETVSNTADSMFLYLNNNPVVSVAGNELSYVFTAAGAGKNRVKIVARNESETASDSIYYFVLSPVTEQELPENIEDGINYLNDHEVTLCLYAPEKSNVFVFGDFNNWEYQDSGFMNRTPDGNRYWKTIHDLVPGKEYIFQYIVDGNIRIGDPYADKVSDPWNDKYITESTYPGMLQYPSDKTQGIATVLQTAQTPYQWEIEDFSPPDKNNLVIYELLVRDFIANHDFKTLTDSLAYFRRLGINAIELMPVNEFEGNLSWGYNPNYYFAPDKYYGPKNDYKHFIDVCHENGIAVIMDIALNHSFGTSPMVMLYWDAANNRPAANNPWFNPVPKHDYNVGYDFNHESEATKYLVDRVVKYWITQYKIDGYRFDLSKGFTQKNTLGNVSAWGQYDASRIAIWRRISDSIWSVKPDAYVILEHFADNSEEKELSADGMMLWGNSNTNFAEAAKGSSSNTNFAWASYKSRGWSEPNLVSYMESHDEERIMYKVLKEGNISNLDYYLRDTTRALERMQLTNVFLLGIPGPKLIWQFGELGYDYTIDYNGRTGEKPIRWDYESDYRRRVLMKTVASMNRLRNEYSVFSTANFTLDVAGYMKKIILNDAAMPVVILGNFNVSDGDIIPGFPKTGEWYEYFSGDSISVTNVNQAITLKKGEYRLYTTQRLENPETGLGIHESGTPSDNFACNVYPNPSGSGFSIDFNVLHSTHLSVDVYDITGRKVAGLFNGTTGPGRLNFIWDPGNNRKGMYFLHIYNGVSSETKRLIYK